MFDRGRLAYQTIEAFGWDIIWKHDKPVPDDAWPIDIINRHIAKAIAAEWEAVAKEWELRNELIAALRGVLTEADRRTDAFDRAHAVLAKAEAP